MAASVLYSTEQWSGWSIGVSPTMAYLISLHFDWVGRNSRLCTSPATVAGISTAPVPGTRWESYDDHIEVWNMGRLRRFWDSPFNGLPHCGGGGGPNWRDKYHGRFGVGLFTAVNRRMRTVDARDFVLFSLSRDSTFLKRLETQFFSRCRQTPSSSPFPEFDILTVLLAVSRLHLFLAQSRL